MTGTGNNPDKTAHSTAAFQAVAQSVPPSRYLEPKDYLLEIYRLLKQRFKSYSYIDFSIDTGFGNCNVMHPITHGNRPLTPKGARKIVDAFGLKGVERQYFIKLVEFSTASDPAVKDEAFAKLMQLKARALPSDLDRNQLAFYKHWYNAAILEILRVDNASDAPEWIADRLTPRVPPLKVTKALDLLKTLGYIDFDASRGRLFPAQSLTTSGPEVYGMAIVSFHHQMIDLAKESIATVDYTERDISALTIAVSNDTKNRIKDEIVAFRRRVIDLIDAEEGRRQKANVPDDKSEIVQLNVQMFPIVTDLHKRETK